MLAFPEMIVPAAQAAGIPTPENPSDFVDDDYPQFRVFCNLQLCRRMGSPTEHWENAKVIAKFTPEQIKGGLTLGELCDAGLQISLG